VEPEEDLRRNNAKTLWATFFYAAIGASTAFTLLTRRQSIPIVAPLQSVGEFSRAFSRTFGEK